MGAFDPGDRAEALTDGNREERSHERRQPCTEVEYLKPLQCRSGGIQLRRKSVPHEVPSASVALLAPFSSRGPPLLECAAAPLEAPSRKGARASRTEQRHHRTNGTPRSPDGTTPVQRSI